MLLSPATERGRNAARKEARPVFLRLAIVFLSAPPNPLPGEVGYDCGAEVRPVVELPAIGRLRLSRSTRVLHLERPSEDAVIAAKYFNTTTRRNITGDEMTMTADIFSAERLSGRICAVATAPEGAERRRNSNLQLYRLTSARLGSDGHEHRGSAWHRESLCPPLCSSRGQHWHGGETPSARSHNAPRTKPRRLTPATAHLLSPSAAILLSSTPPPPFPRLPPPALGSLLLTSPWQQPGLHNARP